VTWGVDFTTQARTDLVGLEPGVNESLIDTLMAWMADGPPRDNGRVMLGIEFYEAVIADDYLMAYSVDESRQRFVVLWLRSQPGTTPAP
jgi:hypothetical protein